MTAQLVALCSPAPGCGKSEVARHLVDAHGFNLIKFADPLKNMVRSLLYDATNWAASELIERYVDGDLKETIIPEIGVSSRHLQVTLGTEWGRDLIRADLWLHLTRQRIVARMEAGINVVVDDMRFQNELAMLEELGATTARVTRPGFIPSTTHRSEGALDEAHVDCILRNTADIAYLQHQTDRLITHA
ncbi:hypothetical protein U1872_06315 [Sphingomonas sp. RB3P16]|uniref:deoxynucleotide monophosphate kinase family protein n=1 Tax=Parasphingomonas frigoris TaxID=3096163 RepID=UPI002FC7B524